MAERTAGWRADIESGDTDRLLNAAWEAVEEVETRAAAASSAEVAMRKIEQLIQTRVANRMSSAVLEIRVGEVVGQWRLGQ